MASRVLPAPEIHDVLSARFVCVKINVDSPPAGAEKLLSQVNGNTLPFFVFATSDAKFVHGSSGYRDVAAFKGDIEKAMKSDLLKVPAEIEKKLAKNAEQMAKDVEAKKIPAAIKAAKSADAVRGFSESKDKIRELYTQVLDGGRREIQAAADLAKEAKFDEAAALLSALSKDFKGSDLDKGLVAAAKALEKVKSASKDANKATAKKTYESIVKDCKDAPPFVALAEARLQE